MYITYKKQFTVSLYIYATVVFIMSEYSSYLTQNISLSALSTFEYLEYYQGFIVHVNTSVKHLFNQLCLYCSSASNCKPQYLVSVKQSHHLRGADHKQVRHR